ncbi:MAG: GDP-L-fucose synthase [Actinomycetota bacterium]|nr:GDP-L-fucose synthase [Actinomycetota bacterium]
MERKMSGALLGKRILVTGGAGFLGSFLCPMLEERGGNVVIAHQRDFDLTEQADVRRLIIETRPEIVIHLAAEVGGIGANRENPGRFFYANASMGVNLIEESRRAGVEKFVQLGTVCAYPKFTPVPFKEDDLWNGYPEETNAPYGIAKKSLLVMLEGYRQQYGFNGIFLLPVNLYGPGDNFNLQSSHVIPALIRKFVHARDTGADTVDVWGTGSASREFLYVEDAARGIILATEQYESSEPVNIGAGREVTIRDLVEMIAGIVGFEGEIRWDSSKPDGQPRRMLDTSRARESFGFEARVELDDGLRRTIAWWETNRETLDA